MVEEVLKVPVLAGKGKRLFDGLKEKTDLELLELLDTKTFKSGAVALHYSNRKK
jgi:hypothetical protein